MKQLETRPVDTDLGWMSWVTRRVRGRASSPFNPWSTSRWLISQRKPVYNDFNGLEGKDATRYGDWEYGGRCTDF